MRTVALEKMLIQKHRNSQVFGWLGCAGRGGTYVLRMLSNELLFHNCRKRIRGGFATYGTRRRSLLNEGWCNGGEQATSGYSGRV